VRARSAAAAPACAVAAVFLALLGHTYRGWTDVTVDFGRELYVAWRIASGEVLYRDIAWLSGPLSAHVNALVFRAFGASLTALALWNTALAAVTFGLVFALVGRYTSRGTAALVTSVAIVVFAFGQHGGIGNYNYVTPYSHEVVHGVLAGALGLVALQVAARRSSARYALLAGLALAASFATKAEPFVATAAGMGAFTAFQPTGSRMRLATRVLTGFCVGASVALALLARQLPLREALTGLLGAWPYVLHGGVTEAAFYERLAGIDRRAGELRTTLAWTAAWLCALVPALLTRRALGPRWTASTASGLAHFVVALGIVLVFIDVEDVYDVGRPTALCLAVVLGSQVLHAVRARASPRPAQVEALSWSAFALALLLKLGLKQTWIFYGFVHALPAFVICAAALHHLVRARPSGASPVHSTSARWWIAGLLVALAVVHARSLSMWHGYKVNQVGRGADRILADGRGDEVAAALHWLDENTEPDTTVLVLPEGLSLNYWSRRRTPLRFIGFMPTELQLLGEASIVHALEQSPPDCVLLVHKDTSDYGVQFFGRDYGRALGGWIGERYEPVALFGSLPFNDSRFGIVALRPR